MSDERARQEAELNLWVERYAPQCACTEVPTAYLYLRHRSNAPSLLALSIEEVRKELDTNSLLVRELLRQLTTYDCTRQRVLGIVFDARTVRSYVLWDQNAH